MLKVELHTHTCDDPEDHIPHTAHQLIDRGAALGYQVIAITLHNKQLDIGPLRTYAHSRGIVLLPGVERAVRRKHVLLINFSRRAERVTTFEEVATLRQDEPAGIVIAPHPFFPTRSCLHRDMRRHPEIFDAVEFNAMYAPLVDFNRAAERWARAHNKPVVGNGDIHRLEQLGTTYSLVDAEPRPDAICKAIRAGNVQVKSTPLGLFQAAWLFIRIVTG